MRAWILVIAACGGSGPQAPAPSGPPAAMVATPAPGDVVVAMVDGRPVWGACVAGQVIAHKITREEARDQCVAFELMAIEAEKRKLATHFEVVDETRSMLVNRLVALDFDQRFGTPDAFRAEIDAALTVPQGPERRSSAHALIQVKPDDAADVVEKRRRAAEQLHTTLANETGLTVHHLRAAAERIEASTGEKIEIGVTGPNDTLEQVYVDALRTVSEVGRVAPVTRTSYGWHVILFSDLQAPLKPAQAEQFAFEKLRAKQFNKWMSEIARSQNVKIEVTTKPLEDREAQP